MFAAPLCLQRGAEPASQAAEAARLQVLQPEVPVDTHVHHTSQRLGLIGPKVNADKAHVIFARVLPPEWVYPLHANLITHGRQVCHAQRPACAKCALYQQCVYVGSMNV